MINRTTLRYLLAINKLRLLLDRVEDVFDKKSRLSLNVDRRDTPSLSADD